MYSYKDIFEDKKTALFVTAHPDDVDVFFGALIHRLIKDGKNVFVIVVTNGARGSRENIISEEELAKKRVKEEAEALSCFNVPQDHFFCLNYKDGEVESNLKLIGELSRFIRKLKPDIVGTHEPSSIYESTYNKDGFFVQHRDHRKVGEAVIDSVYPFSRDHSFFTEHYKEGIEPHTVKNILLTDEKSCNFDFDYTEDLEIKKSALRMHKSQFSEEDIDEIINSVKFDDKYFEKFNYLKLKW